MFRTILRSSVATALVAGTLLSAGTASAAEPIADSTVSVTLSGDGRPLDGVWVTVFRVDVGGLPGLSWSSGPTGADGVFTTRALEAGEYRFEFDPPPGSPYLSGWWKGAVDERDASDLAVDGAGAYAISDELVRGAFVAGAATTTRGGLGEVRVTAHPVSAGQVAVGGSTTTLTASDGSYRIGPLRPGRYALLFTPPAGWIAQWWAGATTSDRAQSVVLRGSETRTRVDVRMSSASATVTGRIRGVSGGVSESLVGAWAALYTRSGAFVTASPTFGGRYTIADVAPGTYLVRFSPPVGSPVQPPYAEEYWPNAASASAARAVTLVAGRTTTLDADLVARPAIPGSIAPLPASVASGATLRAEVTASAPGLRLAYQWLRDGIPIAGAVGRTLRATAVSEDRQLSVAVTGTAPGFAPTVWRADTVVAPR